MSETFRATIEQSGKTASGFEVPDPWSSRPSAAASGRPSIITIDHYTYRSTVFPYTEAFMLPLAAGAPEASGVEAGDEIEVTLALDTGPARARGPAGARGGARRGPAARRRSSTASRTATGACSR